MARTEDDLSAESQTVLIISLALVFAFLSTTAVLLRLYTRSRILRIVGPDDVTISIAQVLAIAVSVTTILEAIWGLGRHTPFVPAEDALRQLQCLYANIMIYNAAQIFTKISFLIQYRRLFPSDRIQALCFWLLLFISAWGLAQEFIVGFSCVPLIHFLPRMAGRCISSLPVWYLTSCMNIVTDFMIFGIPIVPVLRLRISRRKKYLLLGLFCLGFFTCIISLIRLTTLHRSINTADPFWDNAPTAYWSVVELNCGILCACLPTLRPLVQRIIPRLLSTYRGTETDAMEHNGLSELRRRMEAGRIMQEGILLRKEVDVSSITELRENIEEVEMTDSGEDVDPDGIGRAKEWDGDVTMGRT